MTLAPDRPEEGAPVAEQLEAAGLNVEVQVEVIVELLVSML
jgi:hypothetical protein